MVEVWAEQWELMWQEAAGAEPPVSRGNGQRLAFSAQRLTCCVTLSKLFPSLGLLPRYTVRLRAKSLTLGGGIMKDLFSLLMIAVTFLICYDMSG